MCATDGITLSGTIFQVLATIVDSDLRTTCGRHIRHVRVLQVQISSRRAHTCVEEGYLPLALTTLNLPNPFRKWLRTWNRYSTATEVCKVPLQLVDGDVTVAIVVDLGEELLDALALAPKKERR